MLDELIYVLQDLFIAVNPKSEHVTKMHVVSIHANKRLNPEMMSCLCPQKYCY